MQGTSGGRVDERVITKMLWIAVVVVVVAFTAGVFRSAVIKPSVSIVIEDAEVGASNITIVHLGGDVVRDAFAPSSPPSYFLNAAIFENMEVRINGSVYEGWASLNTGKIAKRDFAVGDELELGFGPESKLSQGDTITVVYGRSSVSVMERIMNKKDVPIL